jgi:hypothetical protein
LTSVRIDPKNVPKNLAPAFRNIERARLVAPPNHARFEQCFQQRNAERP